ncbi:MAG: Na+/H+ antiporter NhaC family protein, partial [Gemmatimonadetes bacterium]
MGHTRHRTVPEPKDMPVTAKPSILFAFLLAGSLTVGPAVQAQEVELDAPPVVLLNVPFTITVRAPGSLDSAGVTLRAADGTLLASDTLVPLGAVEFRDIVVSDAAQLPLAVEVGGWTASVDGPLLPGWITLLPPLAAIALALIFREVVSSLFVGVWLGCMFLVGYNPLSAILMTVGNYARQALADADHAAIIIFSLLLGGMVGVLAKMGATKAIVDAVRPFATTPKRGQLTTWLAGLAIFFDDYSNTLIVGNTMRPVTDRLKVSREKLAYIVDSTAAPVSAMVFVSTWVGFEISLIADGIAIGVAQGAAEATVSPFGIFINSIPYLFYPIFALLLVAVLIVSGRDFGPMLAAERRARSGGGVSRPGAQLTLGDNELEPAEGVSSKWWAAALPIGVVVVTVVAGLISTGRASLPLADRGDLSKIFGAADPFVPLLWGAMLGSLTAIVLAAGGRKLTLSATIEAWLSGIRTMILAIIILILAWSLGAVTEDLGTAAFLSSVLSDRLPVELLPVTVFVIAGVVALSIGSSWGTMAILFPLAIPLALRMGGVADPAADVGWGILLAVTAAVMGGALFGDHSSPISDTTILSSMASGCDHVDHVRTQMPYALLAAGVAGVVGSIPAGFGMSPWISLPVGIVALIV